MQRIWVQIRYLEVQIEIIWNLWIQIYRIQSLASDILNLEFKNLVLKQGWDSKCQKFLLKLLTRETVFLSHSRKTEFQVCVHLRNLFSHSAFVLGPSIYIIKQFYSLLCATFPLPFFFFTLHCRTSYWFYLLFLFTHWYTFSFLLYATCAVDLKQMVKSSHISTAVFFIPRHSL